MRDAVAAGLTDEAFSLYQALATAHIVMANIVMANLVMVLTDDVEAASTRREQARAMQARHATHAIIFYFLC